MIRRKTDEIEWSGNGRQRPESEGEERARKQSTKSSSANIFSGNVLYSDSVRRYYPFAIYCCVLILIYMGFTFAGHRLQREEIACRIELQRLRSKSLILSTERLEAVSHDNLIEEIEKRGLCLKQHNTPPTVIGNNE